jgi:hypothetical protein
MTVARPHEQAMQPCVKPLRIAQSSEIAPRFDKRILDGVVSAVGSSEDQASGRVQARCGGRGDLSERLPIAALRPSHQL